MQFQPPLIDEFPEANSAFMQAGWRVNFVFSHHQEDGLILQGTRASDQAHFSYIARPYESQRSMLKLWLVRVLQDLEIYPTTFSKYVPNPANLRFWGFSGYTHEVWGKPSLEEEGRTLFIDFGKDQVGTLTLYSKADQEKHLVLRGPILSDTDLERELRERGWIGISTEYSQ